MNIIYKIARNELKMLFYSPIAWLVIIIFIVQCSIFFSDIVESLVSSLAARGKGISYMSFIFYNDSTYGLFPKVQQYLYLYIPLLTMGLLSKEHSDGSIKLLYSSPVTNTQIVLGKYLSIITYLLLLIFILIAYVLIGILFVDHFDYPIVLSGLLGLYLLACTYAAIGLYMSSLTKYQPVAAIATFVLFAFLSMIGSWGQNQLGLRDITYWLSINGRADEFIMGLISTDNLIYFILISALFVLFTIIRIYNQRNTSSFKKRAGRYLAVVAGALLVGYVSSIPALMYFYDTNDNKRMSLSKNSQEVMKNVKGKATITTYVNLLESHYHLGKMSSINDDIKRFRKYKRFKPDLKMDYVYYYKFPTGYNYQSSNIRGLSEKQVADSIAIVEDIDIRDFLSPDEIDSLIDLSGENYRFVREIKNKNGKSEFLRIYDDPYVHPNEKEVTTAFKLLTAPPARVGFLNGHGERDIEKTGDKDYFIATNNKNFRHALINNGFTTEKVEINKDKNALDSIDILVITDLKSKLDTIELGIIKDYIEKGGNLLLAGDINRQENMNPIANIIGVNFKEGILVNDSTKFSQDLIMSRITKIATDSSRYFRNLNKNKYMITMPGAVGIEYTANKGFDMLPILTTDSISSWSELQTKDFINEKAILGDNEAIEPNMTMIQLTRSINNKKQTIIVTGDADIFSNSELGRDRGFPRSINFDVFIHSFRLLSNGEYPISVNVPTPKDDNINLKPEQVGTLRILYIGVYPFIFLLMAIVILLKRRDK